MSATVFDENVPQIYFSLWRYHPSKSGTWYFITHPMSCHISKDNRMTRDTFLLLYGERVLAQGKSQTLRDSLYHSSCSVYQFGLLGSAYLRKSQFSTGLHFQVPCVLFAQALRFEPLLCRGWSRMQEGSQPGQAVFTV